MTTSIPNLRSKNSASINTTEVELQEIQLCRYTGTSQELKPTTFKSTIEI